MSTFKCVRLEGNGVCDRLLKMDILNKQRLIIFFLNDYPYLDIWSEPHDTELSNAMFQCWIFCDFCYHKC